MIKTKKGSVKIKGNKFEIGADISSIIYYLFHEVLSNTMTPEKAKEFIMHAVERGFKTPEEIAADALGLLKEILDKHSNLEKEQGEEA